MLSPFLWAIRIISANNQNQSRIPNTINQLFPSRKANSGVAHAFVFAMQRLALQPLLLLSSISLIPRCPSPRFVHLQLLITNTIEPSTRVCFIELGQCIVELRMQITVLRCYGKHFRIDSLSCVMRLRLRPCVFIKPVISDVERMLLRIESATIEFADIIQHALSVYASHSWLSEIEICCSHACVDLDLGVLLGLRKNSFLASSLDFSTIVRTHQKYAIPANGQSCLISLAFSQ